jgi:hypothetical protein
MKLREQEYKAMAEAHRVLTDIILYANLPADGQRKAQTAATKLYDAMNGHPEKPSTSRFYRGKVS